MPGESFQQLLMLSVSNVKKGFFRQAAANLANSALFLHIC